MYNGTLDNIFGVKEWGKNTKTEYMYLTMGYGLSGVVVVFSTGSLLKKLWPLEVGLLASSDLWSPFGFVCRIQIYSKSIFLSVNKDKNNVFLVDICIFHHSYALKSSVKQNMYLLLDQVCVVLIYILIFNHSVLISSKMKIYFFKFFFS